MLNAKKKDVFSPHTTGISVLAFEIQGSDKLAGLFLSPEKATGKQFYIKRTYRLLHGQCGRTVFTHERGFA